jgi:2-polyprenyl-3-methyl-5-hydroxy-6-metoxy-1,4-benzoquinol methylase
MLEPGSAALVVIGIDIDAEAIERAAEHAREHTLKREFGDWDEAEHDDLESIARAEQQAMTP